MISANARRALAGALVGWNVYQLLKEDHERTQEYLASLEPPAYPCHDCQEDDLGLDPNDYVIEIITVNGEPLVRVPVSTLPQLFELGAGELLDPSTVRTPVRVQVRRG